MSNRCPTGMQAATTLKEEHEEAHESGQEPEQHVHQVDPEGLFHTLDAAVALWICVVEVQVGKDAKDGGPEDAMTHKVSISC